MAMQESDTLAGAGPQAAEAWMQHLISRYSQKGAPWIPTESGVGKPQLIRSDHKELPLRLRHLWAALQVQPPARSQVGW